VIKDYEWYYTHANGKKKSPKFDVLVTSFEVALATISQLRKIQWSCLVMDEAHRLKGRKSKLADSLSGLLFDSCVMLTGTPLQVL
jgi:chromodomain-helicase-DNA-binding protein 6